MTDSQMDQCWTEAMIATMADHVEDRNLPRECEWPDLQSKAEGLEEKAALLRQLVMEGNLRAIRMKAGTACAGFTRKSGVHAVVWSNCEKGFHEIYRCEIDGRANYQDRSEEAVAALDRAAEAKLIRLAEYASFDAGQARREDLRFPHYTRRTEDDLASIALRGGSHGHLAGIEIVRRRLKSLGIDYVAECAKIIAKRKAERQAYFDLKNARKRLHAYQSRQEEYRKNGHDIDRMIADELALMESSRKLIEAK